MNDATFTLYAVDGLAVHFSVDIDILAARLQQLQAAGWRVTQPTGDARPKVERATGWVLAESEDSKLGKFMPCVHLYAAHGDFKQVTVYHERLAELPFTREEKAEANKHKWDGAAPDRATAQKKGVLLPCDFEFVMEPMLDSAGNPLKTEAGNVKYKFGGVRNAAPTQQPATAQPPQQKSPAAPVQRSAAGNGAPDLPPEEPDFYEDNPFNDMPVISPSDKKLLDPPKANGNPFTSDDQLLVKAREIISAANITEIPALHVWAINNGYRTNEYSSRNEFKTMVNEQFGGKLTSSNVKQALEAFVVRCLKEGKKVAA